MNRASIAGPFGRAICLALVATLGAGCTAYQRFAPPRDGFQTKPNQTTRLTLDDDSRIEVKGLRVDGDSLFFVQHGDSAALAWRTAVGYERKEFDALGTVILVVATGAAIFYGSLFYLAATGAFDFAGPSSLSPRDEPPRKNEKPARQEPRPAATP